MLLVGLPDVGLSGRGKTHRHQPVAHVGFAHAGPDLGEVERRAIADPGLELDGPLSKDDCQETDERCENGNLLRASVVGGKILMGELAGCI